LVAKRAAGVAGSAAGSAAGGFLNNPGALAAIGIVVTIVTTLLVFRKDISEFFSGLGQITLPEITLPSFPDITFPDFPTFPDINIEFPDITFPEFPDFGSIFDDIFGGGPPPPPVDIPPGPVTPDEPPGPGTTTEFPPGCTFDPVTGIIDCPGGGPTFDACAEFPDLPQCQPEDVPITPPVPPEPVPGPELPPGFEGGGPSFEGGIIFETDICNKSIGQIAIENGISASAAADMKFQACEQSDFDFGTNTGAGFGPGDDPLTDPLVTGGATLESEEKKAACTSCELFGLNCPICAGEVGA